MRTDPLADSRLTDGLGNGLVDGAGVEMVAACSVGARVNGPMAGREDVLPSPILVGVRVLARQGVREIHLPITLLQIPLMDHLHAYKVILQGLNELLRERRDTVLISLAVAHREGLHLQIDVLDPESEALCDAQARAVQKFDGELMHSVSAITRAVSLRVRTTGKLTFLRARSALISPLSGCLSTCL